MSITEFKIPQTPEEVSWIMDRVRDFRFFEEPEGHQWEHGANRAYMERLRQYWLNNYDWASTVERLSRYPQILVEVEPDLRLHAIHLKSTRPDARPLLIAHGWPGSILEFEALYDRLANPENPNQPAFHVVAPSLPGYGWSDKPKSPLGPRAIGRLYDKLMGQLGYDNYVYQGGDWGCVIGGWMGLDGQHIGALHLNGYGLAVTDQTPKTDAEQKWLEKATMLRATETGYLILQGTKPQSLGFAMMDSPMGVAAWFAEKYCGWSDQKSAMVEPPFSFDVLLDTIMVYLTTRTFLSATWVYRGMFLEGGYAMPEGQTVKLPVGVAAFPHDLLAFPPRTMVERGYNVVHWTDMPEGGHFAGLECPEYLLADLRQFVSSLP